MIDMFLCVQDVRHLPLLQPDPQADQHRGYLPSRWRAFLFSAGRIELISLELFDTILLHLDSYLLSKPRQFCIKSFFVVPILGWLLFTECTDLWKWKQGCTVRFQECTEYGNELPLFKKIAYRYIVRLIALIQSAYHPLYLILFLK